MKSKIDLLFLTIFLLYKIHWAGIQYSNAMQFHFSNSDEMARLEQSVSDLRQELHEKERNFNSDTSCLIRESTDGGYRFVNNSLCQALKSNHEEMFKEYNIGIQQMEATLTRMKIGKQLDLHMGLMELYNVLFRTGLLLAIWTKKRPVIMFAFLHPIVKYLISYMWFDMYFGNALASSYNKLIFSSQLAQWIDNVPWISTSINFCLKYPILDFISDVHQNMFTIDKKTGDLVPLANDNIGTVFFIIHIYFYIALKYFYVTLPVSPSKDKNAKVKVTKKPKIFAKQNLDPMGFLHACVYGHKDVLKSLLSNPDLDINQTISLKDYSGFTGMHISVLMDHLPNVQLLLNHANIWLKNEDGKNAFELALELDRKDIVTVFMKHKKFKWKHVNIKKVLTLAIERYQFELAQKIIKESKYLISDETSVYLERAIVRSKDLKLKKFSSLSKEEIITCLENYKTAILSYINGTESVKTEDETPLDRFEKFFECPICMDSMAREGVKIFGCSFDHYICGDCLSRDTRNKCPSCREDFKRFKPKQAFGMERLAREVFLS